MSCLGLDYSVSFQSLRMAGEMTFPINHTPGWLHQVGFRFPGWDVNIGWRIFGPRFLNPHGFYLNTRSPSNMTGFTGLVYMKAVKNVRVHAMFDLCRRPWRTWFNPLPTSSYVLALKLDYRISDFKFQCKYRKRRSVDFREPGIMQDERTQMWRMEMWLQLNSRLFLKMRLERILYRSPGVEALITVPTEDEHGMLFYQHLQLNLHRRLNLSLRWISFSSDSYSSRLYQFEDNCPGMLHCIPLYGHGYRFTVFIRSERPGTLFTLKYGFTWRPSSTGSGIDGMNKSYLTAQLDLKW